MDYVNEHPDECREWNVVWSDRGHFTEPHTDRVIGLGTLAARRYLKGYAAPVLNGAGIRPAAIDTCGPAGRYGAMFYIEKEGFDPVIAAAELAERFDLAIMSCKGMSVTAARELIDETCCRYGIPLFVLHDFDISGFSIAQTLHTSNRRYTFRTQSGDDF